MRAPYKLDDEGHAVDRFIERYLRGEWDCVVRGDAECLLESIRANAVHVEDLPDEGQEIWRGPNGWRDVLLVVRDGVVTTVLPMGATRPAGRRR